ncbi:hypothetical protein LOK49_LG13G00726 [Camellia lanceoleosa]|uniref:Uncharacterized protein n=1 Tax=Camellia lanceoleosa TaxID=1840588 RepID=A0ACC0FMB3_9ERIC|nr:hypothetical protein LOK49_LG13G00726 [Camellia lanceoleosa]
MKGGSRSTSSCTLPEEARVLDKELRQITKEKNEAVRSQDFEKVQEAASGSVFVQMPGVWINLAHVHFAQGNFPLAVKMVQYKQSSSSTFYCLKEKPRS